MQIRIRELTIVAVGVAAWIVATQAKSAQTANSTSGTMRIGVVDLVRVFNEFDQTKALNAELEKYKVQISDEKAKREERLDVEKNTLQGFSPDSAEYVQRLKAFKKTMIEHKAWLAATREDIGDEHRAWIERTYTAVTAGIAAVAKQRGIDVVLTREELDTNVAETEALLKQILNRKVVYFDSNLDVTEAVLVNLNETFAREGGAKKIHFGS